MDLLHVQSVASPMTRPSAQERACGCKTADQTGTLNGYMCPWHREKYATALAQAVQAAFDIVDALVGEWEAAYPETVFPPVANAQAYYDGSMSTDRISAHMARHVAHELRKQIAALRARPAEPAGEKG